MAGSFAEARTQILSLRPEQLRTKAEQLRQFGIDARLAGSQLAASADEVGSQRGAPYAAYRERVTPTASWLRGLESPATSTAGELDGAAGAGDRARMVLARQEQVLAALAANPATRESQFAAAEAAALVALNQAIGEVTQAYAAIAPPAPGTAPVVVATAGGGAPAAGSGGASTATGAAPALGGGTAGTGAALEAEPAGGSSAALGPQSGPFAGFVQDPLSGNLVDPATGREVDAGGRFLDPITGQPFGESSPFATRLEGLVGGAAPAGLAGVGAIGAGGVGVPAAGVIGPAAGAVVPAGLGVAGAPAVAGGAVPFLPPAVGGTGALGPSRGSSARLAGLYGGIVPPSLAGPNPAGSQLNQVAAQNLQNKAAVAQRYAAIANGQAPAQLGFLPPPVAGVGGGGTGAARSARRSGPRAVTEPAGVWGAVPGSGRPEERRRRPASSADTEDEDVWTGGTEVAGLLDGR
jgi:hypothetical protein